MFVSIQVLKGSTVSDVEFVLFWCPILPFMENMAKSSVGSGALMTKFTAKHFVFLTNILND